MRCISSLWLVIDAADTSSASISGALEGPLHYEYKH
jgi:hypothetical protein